MSLHFEEEQKFTQYWIFIPLLFAGFIPIIGLYQQMVGGEPFGSKPMSTVGLILFLMLELGIFGLFWFSRLRTEINDHEIKVTFTPFTRKKFKWEDINTAAVVNYGFVGGWGVRLYTKYGTVYNTNGNKGLAIELKNGKKYCIGTQKESELAEIVEGAIKLKKL